MGGISPLGSTGTNPKHRQSKWRQGFNLLRCQPFTLLKNEAESLYQSKAAGINQALVYSIIPINKKNEEYFYHEFNFN